MSQNLYKVLYFNHTLKVLLVMALQVEVVLLEVVVSLSLHV